MQGKCAKCGVTVPESKLMCADCYEAWLRQKAKADDKLDAQPACRPEYTERLPIKE